MSYSTAELFGHISNLIYLAGSLVKGSLAVRISWVLGAIAELLYYVYIASEPLWTSIIWCLIITALNIGQIGLILLSRRKSDLTTREMDLYERLFRAMDIGNFKKMMKNARWEVLHQDRMVISENKPVAELFLLLTGLADVCLAGHSITQIEGGRFIGEMSLLTGQVPSATVNVRAGATLISWTKADVDKLQQADEVFNGELYAVLSRDIIEKIRVQNRQSVASLAVDLVAVTDGRI